MASLPRLVRATVRGEYAGTARRRLLTLVAARLYVVSPIDLVPKLFVPILGLGDGALVVGWIAASVINETESFLTWEGNRGRTVRGHAIS
ncbi:MAG: YkvA family protein [Dermatophilaceae bacterium]